MIDDVLPHGFGRVEGARVGAVGRDANEGDFACCRAARSASDGLRQVHTRRIAPGGIVDLPLPEQRGERRDAEFALALGHSSIHRMIRHQVELELVRGACVRIAGAPFQLDALVCESHVRVPEDDHGLVFALVDGRIQFVLGALIV